MREAGANAKGSSATNSPTNLAAGALFEV